MKKTATEDPPRPPCSSCGSPGTQEVSLECQRLVVDRDAGPRSERYWKPSYKTATKLQTILCDSCTRQQIVITMAVKVTADIESKARRRCWNAVCFQDALEGSIGCTDHPHPEP